MNASSNFVVGQCTRVRDNVFMKARAQSIDGVIRDLTHTAQAEFPPEGEIELRGARAFLKQDDWAIAKPVLDGPPRRQKWISASARKLLPFEDLSGLSGAEASRRLLVETGLHDAFVGEKIYRVSADEMILVKMAKSEDGRTRATSPDMARLPVYGFDATKILTIPTPGGSISLMEKNHMALEVRLANWTSDVQYVEQIVREALASGDQDAKAEAVLAATLVTNAGRLKRLLSGAGEPDVKVVQEISRSQRLAEVVTSRSALVADFMQVLRQDPAIQARIDHEISRLTAETLEAKRAEIFSELTSSMEAELATERRQRAERLEAELADLELSSLKDLAAKIETERNLALTALELRRSSLEQAVDDLQKSRDALHAETRAKVSEIDAINADITRLSLEAVDRKEDIDRLLRMEQVLQITVERKGATVGRRLIPVTSGSPSTTPLAIDGITDWLKDAHLLSEAGKRGVARVATVVLSGGVPVIAGPEADDVLEVLASMMAGGAMVSLDCDPTVISYDDLWCRPGSGEPTVIGQALREVRDAAAVRFCVIRRADLAPARFWIETLRRAGKQNTFPKGLLLCVTRADEEEMGTEGASLTFRAEGWLDRNAGAAAAASMSEKGFHRVVDISSVNADPSAAFALIASARVSITDAKWLAEFAPMAKAVLKGEAAAFAKDVLECIAVGAKPNLKLIDNGGPSRA